MYKTKQNIKLSVLFQYFMTRFFQELTQLVAFIFFICMSNEPPGGGDCIFRFKNIVSVVFAIQFVQLTIDISTASVPFLFRQVCFDECWRLTKQGKVSLLLLLEQMLDDSSIELLTIDSDRIFSVLVECGQKPCELRNCEVEVLRGVLTSPSCVSRLWSSTIDCSEIY